MKTPYLKTLSLCLLILLVSFQVPGLAESIAPLPVLASQNQTATADIEVFVRTGCTHCAEAEQFLAELQREQATLHIVIHNIVDDPTAYDQLKTLAETRHENAVRVPAFWINGELITGYSKQAATDTLIRQILAKTAHQPQQADETASSCEAKESLSCEAEPDSVQQPAPETYQVNLFGRQIRLEDYGLPVFTLVMGVLDGFNPCSIWVLILMISMLAPMKSRGRMLAIAGTFVAVEGIAYFVFMAAWLNLFLLIGLSRISELIIAGLAILAGAINLKDFLAFGSGLSLSIPASAKPNIYARIRAILQADNFIGAIIAAIVLAVLVQIIELMCTSGFPALYTRILTLSKLDTLSYYAYLLLYNIAYMLDDIIILIIGVVTLSQRRLQEKEGRWLKLLSGVVMLVLGCYLLIQGL